MIISWGILIWTGSTGSQKAVGYIYVSLLKIPWYFNSQFHILFNFELDDWYLYAVFMYYSILMSFLSEFSHCLVALCLPALVYIYICNLEYWPLSCFVRFSFKNIVCRQFEHCWLDSQAIGSIISCLVLLILCVLKSKKLVMLEIFMIGSNWMY